MTEEYVILVDESDRSVGTMEKMAAHQQGLLHRAISVFVLDSDGRLLLQQRAAHKYHSAGLWTNTCCSHPAPGETAADAAHRRLRQEMGMEVPLEFAFTFKYRAGFDNGLVEHEVDHVFIGYTSHAPVINPEEVADYRWLSLPEIERELANNPDAYTPWFKIIYRKIFARI
ncbi:isopentenyl-diphosphate Delta-isomerase [Parapedobacter pyrenivorans]|uniref:Isopentenyl-diphosphate delta-isomerase n=1 Tax=Parapedobacter pyrenivorans TaxID=1305674 RepID=A0A917M4N4_9SPHI|nr:isopentenyl-diphosphate Delta-isomerase [Parapedobacter pyrenivorans]GGG78544.1 isopentenyl-diphosphate Delta-isomerase [Parapedobacter pyrenivorans]